MSTPHIRAKEGEFAESILLPGDPLRAKYIAENFLEGAELVTDVRGILGYTGSWKGKRVSVMGTGMGIPSISIYVTELIKEYGVKNLMRIGTCGAGQDYIKLEDVILAEGCCTDSGMLDIFPGDFAPIANFEMLNTAYEKSLQRGNRTFVGLMKSSDLFYGEPVPGDDLWARYGVLGVEMEGAALYTIAARYGARALMLCTVSDSPFEDRELTSAQRETSLNNMIELALDTIIEF